LAFAYSIHLSGKPLALLSHKNPKRRDSHDSHDFYASHTPTNTGWRQIIKQANATHKNFQSPTKKKIYYTYILNILPHSFFTPFHSVIIIIVVYFAPFACVFTSISNTI